MTISFAKKLIEVLEGLSRMFHSMWGSLRQNDLVTPILIKGIRGHHHHRCNIDNVRVVRVDIRIPKPPYL